MSILDTDQIQPSGLKNCGGEKKEKKKRTLHSMKYKSAFTKHALENPKKKEQPVTEMMN